MPTYQSIELNIDGLIGPTHNYSGLSFGNIASMEHHRFVSNPKEAAKQGLEKMRLLASMGMKQAVFPPHERPYFPLLRALGYHGNESVVLQNVWEDSPRLLSACSSAASMWAANAATVSPSADSEDEKVHFTAANLVTNLHRFIEPSFTSLILKKMFSDPKYFHHHPPLPLHTDFADEGAANHTRFCKDYHLKGVQLFVFGRSIEMGSFEQPKKFPARQTLEASLAISRLHRLASNQVIFAQQNPEVIDLGVFHNDVISVGNQNLFFYHEKAFSKTDEVIQLIKLHVLDVCQCPMHFIKIKEEQLTIQESVRTYLFNSQLITLPDQTMVLLAPIECEQSNHVQTYLEALIKEKNHPIKRVIYQDVRQSMQNGGGPACLRLRVALTAEEFNQMHTGVILTESLYHDLYNWIDKHYRDHLLPNDLRDPQLVSESRIALDELTSILKLGPVYSFQR